MSDSHTKPELTPKIILEAFKMLDLDSPQTRNRLNTLSEHSEKPLNDKQNIVTSDNTLEQKKGSENA